MAAFPILKKRVMTPKIPQPQYRLAASISIKGRQVGLARCAPADRLRLSPAVRGCHSCLCCQAATACCLAVPATGRQAGFKRPRWDWNQSKINILPKKPDKSSDTWLCQIRSIIVSIRYLQCDLGQFTANIYRQSKCSQTTVKCIFAGLVSELANWVLSQLDWTS